MDAMGVNLLPITFSSSLNTNEADVFIFDEIVERANSITSSTNASDNDVRKFTACLLHLVFNLFTDDLLKVPNDGGEGMRSDG